MSTPFERRFERKKFENRRFRTRKRKIHRFSLPNEIRRSFEVEPIETRRKTDFSSIKLVENIRQNISSNILRFDGKIRSIGAEILGEIRFVGQFDRKFLIYQRRVGTANAERTEMIFFDQHAVSERILLERLEKHFRRGEIRSSSRQLAAPVVLPRNPRFIYDQQQIELLERLGFVFLSVSNRNLLVRSIPNWIFSIGRNFSSIEPILRQTVDIVLNEFSSELPEKQIDLNFFIYETLKSVACHNAIKFNDLVSDLEAKHLVDELRTCSMPLICAHGRTSTAILCDVETIHDDYRVNIDLLKDLASIHSWMKNC